ncbi:DMT family transporter [Peribacillus asahii]|uniref:DMT family transporter n=1 Tax=Peribacillus asahii TaxID=228899 RepID=UPI00207A3034|nr:EamA family transporter [Peribacillus asahii]USK59617.1 DMT family transporter [Peribacillus asahii]
MDNKLALLLIGAGASLWGIISLFVTSLYEMGFSPIQVVTIRALSATLFLVLYIIFKNRQLLKIKAADSKYFIGTGIFSFVLFNWCMFSAIKETSISVATILLYTAPAFVTIFSRFIFKELLTTRKVLALLITFIGCSFVVGILPNTTESISLYGLILGLGSGLFYALYSIFGKFALRKYNSLTVTAYTFLFAAIAVTPFSGLWLVLPLFSDIKVWVYIIGLGFLSTMLPFIFYTKGLNTIESSQASIIATIEPVVASLVGFLIFHEKLNVWQYLGIFLVIAAVVIVQETSKKTKKSVISNELSI